MKLKIIISTLFILSLFFAFQACNISSSGTSGEWKKCEDTTRIDESAECRSFNVPLDYRNPREGTISISAFRYVNSENAKAQIWFLEGGPGGSGRLLSRTMLQLDKYYPTFDYYSLDHRGVGLSTRFGCEDDNNIGDDWDAYRSCYEALEDEWGENIKMFSTTNAARDIHEVLKRSKEEGKKVFIWGTSYGTYWLLRYLQLYPNVVDGVILDSICTPGHCYLDNYDKWNDMVGTQFLQLCEEDAVCHEKMATVAATPVEAFDAVFSKVDDGTLPEGCNDYFTKDSLRHTLGVMLNNWSIRMLAPALVYRLNRCNAEDQEAIEFYLDQQNGAAVDRTLLNSPMLCDLVSLSELNSGNSSDDLGEFLEGSHFGEDASYRFTLLNEMDIWDTYKDLKYAQKLPETDIPLLMLNGTTDPQTPIEIAGKIIGHFSGAHQHFVTVPFSTHGVLVNSPITPPAWALGGQEQTCGSLILGQFLNDPTGILDTSCTEDVYPVDFNSDTDNNKLISIEAFGTENMWE